MASVSVLVSATHVSVSVLVSEVPASTTTLAVIVYGKDKAQHDENLTEFMTIAAKHGLTLNSKKCDIETSKVEFFGNIYTDQGMSPDRSKKSHTVS